MDDQSASFFEKLDGIAGWDQLALPAEAITTLHQIARRVEERPQGRGVTALFSGVSGTGKTMAAEVLGNHLKQDVYRVDLASVVSKYIGETEKNLRRVLAAAEERDVVLLFDEADALFGLRTEPTDESRRYANLETGYLLERIEHFPGLAILTTNTRSNLDEAFVRRLHFVVEFPFPDVTMRRRIWQTQLPPDHPISDGELDALARIELSGADIATIAINAVQPLQRVSRSPNSRSPH